jgi:hypothetical protein
VNLKQYTQQIDILSETEIEKVKLLAYYFHKTQGKREFDRSDITAWFDQIYLPRPNITRLFQKIRKSKDFVIVRTSSSFRLHAVCLDEMQSKFPGIHSNSEEVLSEDTVLPGPIYQNTRGFIESLAKQINASFEYNIYDGCAVLMRRLLEICIILSYEHSNIDPQIRDTNGNYQPLEMILSHAKTCAILKLSRDTKSVLDEFRVIGNFSAHKIYYNCRRDDLKTILKPYRATIEELLYKAGIKK